MNRIRLVTVLAAGLALGWAAPAARADVDTFTSFGNLPVLSNGRVMPMDSFARNTLLGFSGKSRFERTLPATHWLCRVFFTPEATLDDEMFLVNNPEVLEGIGVPGEGRRRVSFRDLQPALGKLRELASSAWQIESDARSPVEKELIRLYSSVWDYTALRQAFSFALPSPDFAVRDPGLRAELGLPEGATEFSLLEIRERAAAIAERLAALREAPPESWTPAQQELAGLSQALRTWPGRRPDRGPQMIPLPGHGHEHWVTPWEAVTDHGSAPGVGEDLAALADLAGAFREGNQVGFDLAARTLLASVAGRDGAAVDLANLSRELRFNRSQAFYRAELLYGMAFLAALFAIMFRSRWAGRAALGLVVLGLLPHTYGIVARMQIMGRPPVTNLYSTFVFVGWASVLLGLALEYLQRNRLGLLTAAVSGLALLLTSGRFAADGDTMGVMVAVLDSNFWLATHVVTISVGYAGCCVAGLIGHVYLLQALRRRPGDPVLTDTFDAMYGALAFGLIFAFLGTMLGGVWADQSWGRFWGWDPKENGALVIVLWSAILFHARLADMIGPRGFAVGSIIGIVWVLLAWLGVNLLNVGLHSYGFTSSLARGLLIACAVEVAFVVLVPAFARRPAAG